ncbi:hypothetical protein BGZ51_000296 [Haplosporangium sp. Z 767]|nr:hypothetical protein BGZ51_000296 [Haplosporangium sp. Z 767]
MTNCTHCLKTFPRGIVQEYQRIMTEEAAVMEAKENAYRLYAEERQARLKQERISRARKIAPGFLDNEDRRILTPTLATAQAKDQIATTAQSPSTKKSKGTIFDYSEFEASADSQLTDDQDKNVAAESSAEHQHPHQAEEQQGSSTASGQEAEREDGTEEEVIVQAVPLSELTGMLRDSCLDDESSSPAPPRPWVERNAASEKSTLPTFNAATRLDFREFEQGLGPPDPWDTPVDDLTALKDVISQQMGHSSSQPPDSAAALNRPQPIPTQPQHQQHQQTYSYQSQQHTQSAQSYQQSTGHSLHGQYPYSANIPNRTGYNSSPIPAAAYVPPPKLTGIAQQQQALQHHQQNRHSTGGTSPHPMTGLTANQQHARFGKASPSPPPLPPPPRAGASSPAHTSATGGVSGAPASGVSRPPLPARPHHPTDQPSADSPITTGVDHVAIMDRSMTPPRPPLPPPPPLPPGQPVGAPSSSTSGQQSLGASGSGGAPPALRPRPPKDHEMLHGILGPNKTSSSVSQGLFSGQGMDDHQQQQQVAPTPPQANSLIEQLVNMGFTREQSRGALEKYDYDLEKATNHLLDWDE